MPQVSSQLGWRDRAGAYKVRWGIGRMGYRVVPGLYALNQPDRQSPVLVTASYKMSFDQLRSALAGLSAWILVLDTAGVNVWCAAGKGTFGTDELISRIKESRAAELVEHRQVILPQLGAPGIAAYKLRKAVGFRAVYGPIAASDIPAFLAAGAKTTPAMRRKRFPLGERAALIPIELIASLKLTLPIALALTLIAGLLAGASFLRVATSHGVLALSSLLVAVLAGAVVTPLLLPWLPGRAFSCKGMVAGLLAAAAAMTGLLLGGGSDGSLPGSQVIAWLLLIPALSSFMAMNFTGASTFTSLSGVRREMRLAVPLQITSAVIGLGFWFASVWQGG